MINGTKEEKKIWENLKENLGGYDNESGGFFIDFGNTHFSISYNDVTNMKEQWIKINEEIESFIEEKRLDNVQDLEIIKAEFPQYEDYFDYNQATIKYIEEFAIIYFKQLLEKADNEKCYFYDGNEWEENRVPEAFTEYSSYKELVEERYEGDYREASKMNLYIYNEEEYLNILLDKEMEDEINEIAEKIENFISYKYVPEDLNEKTDDYFIDGKDLDKEDEEYYKNWLKGDKIDRELSRDIDLEKFRAWVEKYNLK